MKRFLFSLGAGLLLAGTGAAQDAVKGKTIFDGNCASCHSIKDQIVGPALKDVHERHKEEWVIKFVKNSGKLIASGDKEAVAVFEKFGKIPMTNFEGSLSDEDIKDVVAYIKEESEKPDQAEVAPVTPTGKTGVTPPSAGLGGGFDWKAVPSSTQLLLILIGFLLMLVILLMAITFFQALPLLGKLYEKPALQNTYMARLIALMRGDTRVLTGNATNVVLDDHDYDGIQEFDNDLPPWWKYSFYATIVFGVVYLIYYHVMGGQLQIAEYETEVQQASLISAAIGGDDANEKTDFTLLTEPAALEAGKALYTQNCAACHGAEGQGVVGPNLTDEFWLHGGGINDVFKVVKHGVTSKGMVAWKGKLSNDQILEVSSFILSLQGSNPSNPKEPQGEKAK